MDDQILSASLEWLVMHVQLTYINRSFIRVLKLEVMPRELKEGVVNFDNTDSIAS